MCSVLSSAVVAAIAAVTAALAAARVSAATGGAMTVEYVGIDVGTDVDDNNDGAAEDDAVTSSLGFLRFLPFISLNV